MKKILLFSLLLILIPYIIISILVHDKEMKFVFTSNAMVRVKRTSNNQIDTIPLEEYVMGVLAGEVPISFNIEALKAQAVASRSYVMYQMIKNKDNDYDVVDTTLNQVYLDDNYLKQIWGNNYDEYKNKIKDAIMKTAYQYITYNGELAEALFFSTSSGLTENSEDVFITSVPYLRSVESPYDAISPAFNNVVDLTYDVFCNLLGIKYTTDIKVEVLSKTPTGRINSIKINEKTFTGSDVASLLGLKSSNFSINNQDGKIYITTKGFGHGVGMSQYGAEGMANQGFTYDEILKHYYTGIEIEKIKN
jgi:stage II sporulation protein D